jgi:probable HAF family extracellular repeat protein
VGGSNRHAFLWDEGTMQDLGWLGSGTAATAINNQGQIAGTGLTPRLLNHAFVWDRGQMIDLGALAGDDEATALGLSEGGQVAGNSSKMTCCVTTFHPFVWQGDSLQPLSPTYGTDPDRRVIAINQGGLIVGNGRLTFSPPFNNPWVWESGETWELGSLGGRAEVAAVNAGGDVVGWSERDDPNQLTDHAVLWRRIDPAVAVLSLTRLK